ncbi:hypothetical protein Y032_0021g365 [Ancylostoma ceylanicum]|uniref:Uncharacterized protein n=1 Tax=Ancylostoma ceylanicum TaxID=53326 RepID=A0A016V0Z8_9BILA|nr:hypothetical protein Y032_0021g365 [Ancylostoma ceylanicum]
MEVELVHGSTGFTVSASLYIRPERGNCKTAAVVAIATTAGSRYMDGAKGEIQMKGAMIKDGNRSDIATDSQHFHCHHRTQLNARFSTELTKAVRAEEL